MKYRHRQLIGVEADQYKHFAISLQDAWKMVSARREGRGIRAASSQPGAICRTEVVLLDEDAVRDGAVRLKALE